MQSDMAAISTGNHGCMATGYGLRQYLIKDREWLACSGPRYKAMPPRALDGTRMGWRKRVAKRKQTGTYRKNSSD